MPIPLWPSPHGLDDGESILQGAEQLNGRATKCSADQQPQREKEVGRELMEKERQVEKQQQRDRQAEISEERGKISRGKGEER